MGENAGMETSSWREQLLLAFEQEKDVYKMVFFLNQLYCINNDIKYQSWTLLGKGREGLSASRAGFSRFGLADCLN